MWEGRVGACRRLGARARSPIRIRLRVRVLHGRVIKQAESAAVVGNRLRNSPWNSGDGYGEEKVGLGPGLW